MADNKQLKNNEQIKFLHGTQATLDRMMSSTATAADKAKIEAGAFYLTTDSHRMYLAQADKTIVPINDSIQKIASINALPDTKYVDSSVSTFYYCIAENVLCIGVPDDATGWKWIQINPDTSITNRTFNTSKVTEADGSKHVKVTDTITDSNGDNYPAFWGFDETNGNVTITVATKTYAEGTGENPSTVTRQMFTIKCNVVIGTIDSGTTGTGIIKLTNSGDDDQKVIIKPATNAALAISSDNAGNITIDDKNLRDADITGITQDFDAVGNLTTTLERGTDTQLQVTVTPTITYGNSEISTTFIHGVADLDVYTIEEVNDKIDEKLALANAMTFIGVLSPDSATHKTLPVPSNGELVRIGDTYKVGKNQSYDTTGKAYATGTDLDKGAIWAILGDLFIATGTENATTGYIDQDANLNWEYVPAGNEESVDYQFSTQSHGLKVEAGNSTLLDFKLNEGTAVTLSDETTDDAKGKTVTINHADVERAKDGTIDGITQVAATASNPVPTTNITYIKEVITNDQGHVTQVNTQTVTLTDTNAKLESVTLDAAAVNNANAVTLTSTVQLTHPADSTDYLDAKSDIMTLKSLNNNLTVAVDESGAAVAFNLVWGTF